MNQPTRASAAATARRIRELNDIFRRTLVIRHGHVLITCGVSALPVADQAAIMRKVQTFDAFTDGNDPHGEHDFGAIAHDGTRYFWKIDYYDLQKRYASPDPADPTVTCRVLTVMRADEY